jgi:hypothetical protein
MRPLLVLLACVTLAASCKDGGTAGLRPSPELLNGTWVTVPLENGPPGSGFSMLLSLNGSTIAGAGAWHGEAGPSGSIAATGHLAGTQITLDIAFIQLVNGVEQGRSTERFVGQLTSRSDLEGTTTNSGLTGTLHLRKVPPA